MKKAFRFRLGRVARVRELYEETTRAEFAEALVLVHEAEDKVAELRASVRTARDAMTSAQHAGEPDGGFDVRTRLAHEDVLERLLGVLQRGLTLLDSARREAELRRSAWQAANADKQALERLEERERAEHRLRLEVAANADSDEVASQRAFAAAREGPSPAHGPREGPNPTIGSSPPRRQVETR